jgi:hypothetical protein
MHELMIGLAMLLPEEQIIDDMAEALTAYKIAPTEDGKRKLATHCMLFAMKVSTEEQDMVNVMNEVSEKKRIIKAFDHHKM